MCLIIMLQIYRKHKIERPVQQRARTASPSRESLGGGLAGFAAGNPTGPRLARMRENMRARHPVSQPRTARQTLLAARLNDRLAAHARSAQHNSTAVTSPQTRSGLRLSAALA